MYNTYHSTFMYYDIQVHIISGVCTSIFRGLYIYLQGFVHLSSGVCTSMT